MGRKVKAETWSPFRDFGFAWSSSDLFSNQEQVGTEMLQILKTFSRIFLEV